MGGSRLKHGVFLAPYHPLEEGVTTWFARDLEFATILENLGFDELWVGEHHSGGFETIASPELFIAAAAAMTKRMRFGTGVISLPYHNPLTVANRIAQLDHQTMGRVSYGFGPGLLVSDAQMFGIDPSRTRDMLDERIRIVLRLLSGETVTASGEGYNLVNARAHLLPYSEPLPEIAVASAVTPSGGRLAGELGASMLCVAASQAGAFDVLDTNWRIACETAARDGRSMDPRGLRLVAPVHLAETREKARANVKHGIERWGAYYNITAPRPFTGSGDELIDNLIASGRAIIGTPDDAVALIKRLKDKQGDFGVFLAQHTDWADWDQTRKSFELYARYVIPQFTRAEISRRASYDDLQSASAEHLTLRKAAMDQAFRKHEEVSK